jgi:hypothetical protein
MMKPARKLGSLGVVGILAFLQFQRASRDFGSRDCGAAGARVALAECGIVGQTFHSAVGCWDQSIEPVYYRFEKSPLRKIYLFDQRVVNQFSSQLDAA